jgi:putative endonuclease
MLTPKREIGDEGEREAERWLRRQGYDIVARNVQTGHKEIDLICRDGDTIVFVEVKSGRTQDFGHPVYRVTRKKRRALVMAARMWMAGQGGRATGYRFDVVSVITDTHPPTIEHLPAAFRADDIW